MTAHPESTPPSIPAEDLSPPADPPPHFWRRPEVMGLTSLLSSLTVHILLITLAILTYTAYVELKPIQQEQTIIPDAALIERSNPGGPINPGLGGDPLRPSSQDQTKDVLSDAQSFSSTYTKPLSSSLLSDPGAQEANSLIGIGKGQPVGKTAGPGTNDVGPAAPLGIPGGGSGIGPKSPFMGIGGNALRVAYVCDSSGSMVDKMDFLKQELVRSVGVLKPIQSFNVIFFNADVRSADERSLVLATPENKRKVEAFITNVVPSSNTNPLPALDLAFRQNAQLIYLLTDGEFENPDNETVRKHIRRLNATHKVKINTIAFVASRAEAESSRSREFIDFLEKLAKENGGVSRVVASKDLEQ